MSTVKLVKYSPLRHIERLTNEILSVKVVAWAIKEIKVISKIKLLISKLVFESCFGKVKHLAKLKHKKNHKIAFVTTFRPFMLFSITNKAFVWETSRFWLRIPCQNFPSSFHKLTPCPLCISIMVHVLNNHKTTQNSMSWFPQSSVLIRQL